MKLLPAFAAAFIAGITSFSPSLTSRPDPPTTNSTPPREARIQAAILLDVSSSMDGLIEQAKLQLWNMVSVMGRVKCENGLPKIEIALYEYGKASNDPKAGYIKRITPFSQDLDNLSQQLFSLTTYGGSEYCGQVIHTSLDELAWDTASTNYKVIFIAGNEEFQQGPISFTQACEKAKKKGVIVNTIYCGNREQGIREHWNLGIECGNGSFTHIDQNAKIDDIDTPFDSVLFSLNSKLNHTYLAYGSSGYVNYENQSKVDAMNYRANKNAAAKRVEAKSKSNVYSNSSWDLVDAYIADSTAVLRMTKEQLPDSLKQKSRSEIQKIVVAKKNERAFIQKQIADLSVQRDKYIAIERTRQSKGNASTLQSAIEQIIREQVTRFSMYVE